jgi:predicted dehydrogenase
MAKEKAGREGASATEDVVVAPELDYRPPSPANYNPNIGVIACGGIVEHHLDAYRKAGFRVTALCDVDLQKAKVLRDRFYPDAMVYTDFRDVLALADIEVVDIATHPPERVPIVERAIEAGKHVLGQKPFAIDLDIGERLVAVAAEKGVLLAVNQNGRWAPHFRYAQAAIEAGLLGDVCGVHLSVHWDHTWVAGTKFEQVEHLVLYDFAIHWFDMVCCLLNGRQPKSVFASRARSKTQAIAPPLLGQALIEFDGAQASLAFDADTPFGAQDRTFIAGSRGSLSSIGPGLNDQQVTLTTEKGEARPELTGSWFNDGFHGTMGELLCAIEQNRQPSNSAANNLQSLALCFAGVASSVSGQSVVPGTVRKLPGA